MCKNATHNSYKSLHPVPLKTKYGKSQRPFFPIPLFSLEPFCISAMKNGILGLVIAAALNAFGSRGNVLPDSLILYDSLAVRRTLGVNPDYGHRYNRFSVEARVNYMKGKYDYLGVAVPVIWWCRSYDLPIEHIGFSAGIDFKISGAETVYAPKLSFEYRYLVLVGRVGHQYYTDFRSRSEHRLFIEAGFSILGFLDITYLHAFGFNGDPFRMRSSNLNVTLSIPISNHFWKTGALWK